MDDKAKEESKEFDNKLFLYPQGLEPLNHEISVCDPID
jgi:hypothetical protein